MTSFKRFLAQMKPDNKGATAVEYGLLLSLMVLALIAALGTTGDRTQEKWDDNAEKIVNATTK